MCFSIYIEKYDYLIDKFDGPADEVCLLFVGKLYFSKQTAKF